VKVSDNFFIADLKAIRLETHAIEPFSGEGGTISGFALLVFVIEIGCPAIPLIGLAFDSPLSRDIPAYSFADHPRSVIF
jgi:hypothetical protein